MVVKVFLVGLEMVKYLELMSEEDTLRALNLAKSIDDEVTFIVFTLEKYDEEEI